MGSKKTDKHKKKKKYRSSSSDTSSSSSVSSIDEEIKKKLKKKLKKLKKKKKEKRALKKLAKEKLQQEIQKEKKEQKKKSDEAAGTSSYDVNVALMEKAKALAPMTKEEWEKQQNILRRVYDEETGRTRLIKGSGEIMEECVSRERHLAINKQATRGDGEYFQKILGLQKE